MVHCPSCDCLMELPISQRPIDEEVAAENTPRQLARPAAKTAKRKLDFDKDVKKPLIFACFLVWFYSLASTFGSSGSVYFGYGFQLLGLGAGCSLVARSMDTRHRISVFVVAVLLFGSLARYDFYRDHWETEFGAKVTDSIWRWSNEPFYRQIKDGDFWASGDLSPTGKKNGEWQFLSTKNWKTESLWYWYDEEITEGEWHLRNK